MRLLAALAVSAALLVRAAEVEIDPFGAWKSLMEEEGELFGDLNGDGVLDEQEVGQIEQAAQSMSEQFKEQLKSHLKQQITAAKAGGSKLRRSRVASMELALQQAASDNQYERVESLLEKGANPNGAYPETGFGAAATPLHAAAEGGFKDIVDLLLYHNATVDPKGPSGETPLHLAARKGRASTVELLLRNGAPTDNTGVGGETALYAAAEMGHTLVVRLLLGANASSELRAHDGGTPLHAAAVEGHVGAAEELLNAGAEVDAKDNGGVRPLVLASAANHLDIEHLLMRAGAAAITDDEMESASRRPALEKVKVQATTMTFSVQARRDENQMRPE